MIENWKPLKGFEGHYEISNLNNMRSLKFGKQLIMKPYYTNGQMSYNLTINGVTIKHYIRAKRPAYKYYIDYKEGEKLGNHIIGSKHNLFICGLCGSEFYSTFRNAARSASCGCAMKKVITRVSDVTELIKVNPYLKIREIAEKLSINFSLAQKYRVQAFKQL